MQKGQKSWLAWQFNLSNLFIWDSRYFLPPQKSRCRIWNWHWVQNNLTISTSPTATTSTKAPWHFSHKSTNSYQAFKACLRIRSWQHAPTFRTLLRYCLWGQPTQELQLESWTRRSNHGTWASVASSLTMLGKQAWRSTRITSSLFLSSASRIHQHCKSMLIIYKRCRPRRIRKEQYNLATRTSSRNSKVSATKKFCKW